jgi:hypothetical protein
VCVGNVTVFTGIEPFDECVPPQPTKTIGSATISTKSERQLWCIEARLYENTRAPLSEHRLSSVRSTSGDARRLAVVLVALYVISAALEVFGIGFVVADVRADREKARALIEQLPALVYGGSRIRQPSREDAIMRRGGETATKLLDQRLRAEERQLRADRANYEAGYAHLLRALHDMLHGSLTERLRGPVLITLGVIVGLVANIVSI